MICLNAPHHGSAVLYATSDGHLRCPSCYYRVYASDSKLDAPYPTMPGLDALRAEFPHTIWQCCRSRFAHESHDLGWVHRDGYGLIKCPGVSWAPPTGPRTFTPLEVIQAVYDEAVERLDDLNDERPGQAAARARAYWRGRANAAHSILADAEAGHWINRP